MSDLGVVIDGAVLIDGERIVEVGPARRIENLKIARKARIVDATGKVVLPGLVDPHSRPLFELTDSWSRFLGTHNVPRRKQGSRRTSPRSMQAATRQWTYEMAACGTTTVEIRTAGEYAAARRQLRTVSMLSGDPIEAAGVFSAGADSAVDSLEVADVAAWAFRTGNAYACEIPCGPAGRRNPGVRRLAAMVQSAGLRTKLLTGNAAGRAIGALADETSALSVDIGGKLHPADVPALASSQSISTLLPGLSHCMRTEFPPGRELIDHGGAVCLATAFGPDASSSLSLPMMMTIACREMELTAEEAITACTINAAAAMSRQEAIGSLEPGKRADLTVFNVPDYRLIPHYFGFNLCAMTIRQGKIIYRGATAPRAAPVRTRQT